MLRALRRMLFAVAGLAGLLVLTAAAPQNRFVTGTEDVPLMPGLSETPAASMIFDTPSGRTVQAYAEGEVLPQQVLGFYDKTLPQLGWRLLGDGRFRRDGEELKAEFGEAGAATVAVRFVLSPSRESGRP